MVKLSTTAVVGIVLVIAVVAVIAGYCLVTLGGEQITSIKEISEHPDSYIGKEVTVEGYVHLLMNLVENARYKYVGIVYERDPREDASPNYILRFKLLENVKAELINFSKYRLTGVIQEEWSIVVLIVSRVESG